MNYNVPDGKVEKLQELIVKLLKELENLSHSKIKEIAPIEEIDNLFIKTALDKDMLFDIAVFNSKTNAVVIKSYEIVSLLTICTTGTVESMIHMDIKELYEKSKAKIYSDVTEIYLN